MKPTVKEINQAIADLQAAMLESIAASNAEEDAKVRKIKAHKALTMARDEIRGITFN